MSRHSWDERRRILAANALRDIGDPRAVPYLIHVLEDPLFTVRYAVERALSELGPSATKAVLRVMGRTDAPALQHMIHVLGNTSSRKAVRTLKHFEQHEDEAVRAAATRVLAAIEMGDAE